MPQRIASVALFSLLTLLRQTLTLAAFSAIAEGGVPWATHEFMILAPSMWRGTPSSEQTSAASST